MGTLRSFSACQSIQLCEWYSTNGCSTYGSATNGSSTYRFLCSTCTSSTVRKQYIWWQCYNGGCATNGCSARQSTATICTRSSGYANGCTKCEYVLRKYNQFKISSVEEVYLRTNENRTNFLILYQGSRQ